MRPLKPVGVAAFTRALAAIAVCAACGAPDAKMNDAAPSTSDASLGQSRVTMYGQAHGTPFEGGIVLSYDASGSLVARAMTDASGTAMIAIADLASVVAIRPSATAPHLWTYLAVENGDELVAGDPTPPCDPSVIGAMKVDIPIMGGATSYEVNAPDTTITVTSAGIQDLPITGCTGSSFAVFVIGRDNGIDGNWSSNKLVTYSNGGTIAFHSPQPFGQFAFNMSNIPVPPTGRELLVERRDGRFESVQYTSIRTNTPTFASSAVALLYPPDYGDHAMYEISSTFGSRRQHYHFTGSTSATNAIVDFAPLLLPDVATNSFAQTTISWTIDGAQPFDGTYAAATYSRGSWHSTWTVVAPSDVFAVTLPDLPTDVAELAPQTSDTRTLDVSLIEGSPWADYQQFKVGHSVFTHRRYGTFIPNDTVIRVSH